MKLQDVVPWGRTLDEYRRMFNLSEVDLHRQILGCGDGPASFNAELMALGHPVISIDPIYQFSAEQIRQRVQEVYDPIITQVKARAEHYVWTTFQDADALGQARLAAMETFLQDYARGKVAGRYRAQTLPKLDFPDGSFDLCLCSHLLFLYSDQRSLSFHQASIDELLRVAPEVRIFPLVTLAGDRSPYLEPLQEHWRQNGVTAGIEGVDYEFQKGGNEMLVLRRPLA